MSELSEKDTHRILSSNPPLQIQPGSMGRRSRTRRLVTGGG